MGALAAKPVPDLLESPPALVSYGLQTTPGGGVVSVRVTKPLDCHLREVRAEMVQK